MGSSEEITGRLIREFGLNRDDIVVATKVYMDMRPGRPNGRGLSRKEIMNEIDKSLKRLGMDYVDLYQIHRPDPNTPFEETMEALHDVVKSGKARYIGACTMYTWHFQKMQISYGVVAPHIINRTATGWCPLETRCFDCATPEECFHQIKVFYKQMKY